MERNKEVAIEKMVELVPTQPPSNENTVVDVVGNSIFSMRKHPQGKVSFALNDFPIGVEYVPITVLLNLVKNAECLGWEVSVKELLKI